MSLATLPISDLPAAEVSLQMFGALDVRVGSEPLPRLHSQRGLWLLALLALHGRRPMERSRLAGMLWPESPETSALHNLRQTLADLRRALGPAARCLVADKPRTLRLDLSRVTVDVLAFDQAVATGDLPALERAAELYQGPLLVGCDEPWAIEEREVRGQSYLKLLERLAAERMAVKDHSAAVRWLRLAIAADPYCESAHCSLIKSLAATGELTAATEVYRDLRLRLHRDLNTQPDPSTTAAFREIRECCASVRLQAPLSLATPWRRAIPVPPTPLIGRKQDVRQIIDLLARTRLVTITGAGGMGKTRLALQVARELTDECEDPVAFVGLAGHTDPATVADAVCEALGIASDDARQETIAALRQYLFAHCVLLVLDNCEHLLAACTVLVEDLLSHCEDLRILTTTRHALGLSSETVWRVQPLALPPSGVWAPMSEMDAASGPKSYAAVELFLARAQGVEGSFRMTSATAPLIVEICRQLDGIPLAIELAAARVRSLSLEEIHGRLCTGLGLLLGGGPTLLPRHQTLEAAFEWSWNLLSALECALLRRLAVFVGGWTLEAAEAVCSGAEIIPDAVVDLLTSLVDNSLVVFVSAEREIAAAGSLPCEARYHLLEPIRQFATHRLTLADEQERVCRRHRDFFLEWAEAIKPKLFEVGQERWFDCLEADHDNLRAALRWCRSREGDAEEEIRLVVALARLWDTHGHLREGRDHLDAAIARITSDLPPALRAGALVHAGWIAAVQSDNPAARDYYGRALTLLEESGDQQTRGDVLGLLALVVQEEGDLSSARTLLEESLRIRRHLGSKRLGSLLNNLGCIELQLCHEESSARCPQQPASSGIELQLCHEEAARAYLEESAYYCEHITTWPQQLAITLCNLAEVDLRQKRYQEAEIHCAASLRIARECGAIINIPDALDQMAEITRSYARWVSTARLLGAAEGLRAVMGLPPAEAEHADAIRTAENALGAETFADAIAEGRRMSLDQAIACALGETSASAYETENSVP